MAIYDDNQGHPGNFLSYNSHNNGPHHNPQTHNQNNYYHETLGTGVDLDAGEIYWVAIHPERQYGPPDFNLAENSDYHYDLGLVQYGVLPQSYSWSDDPFTYDDSRAFWFMIS
ncbi:MAG: hypothetical protein MKZ57_06775 [Candidatus Poseidoniaceae archaeon]|nr:hypothetical protein [Candidatus Poseidoniaceae archaeon]